MSEVDTRPATRGRSSHRGGRGGFGRGGPRGGRKQVNGSSSHDAPATEEILADEGELGDMKRQYASELPTLKELFPDWNDVDLVFALQECDGDLTNTIERISQGSVSQFSEVKNVKDRARSKVKEEPSTTTDKVAAGRGGRGRGGLEASRGRGGRGSERGRGGHRGGRGGHASTEANTKDSTWASVPTTESSAWSKEPIADTTGTSDGAGVASDSKNTSSKAETTEPEHESHGAIAAVKKTWASMFASKPAAPAPKQAEKHVEKSTNIEPQPPVNTTTTAPEVDNTTEPILTEATKPAILASAIIADNQAALTTEIAPSTIPLTEENVEHLPDESHPPATQTVASTVGSNDPRNLTPMPPGQQPPIARPQLGGFATSAHRAASGSFRSASYQRRVQEQQEAVVMPGHNAVDRAAVQFGSIGLGESAGLDVDDEREEIETRQAPQHSPPSQPKTSLPPASKSGIASDIGLAEGLPTKQAPGLPPASQQNQPSLSQDTQQDQSQLGYQQNQYNNYAQSALQQDAQQKQYDPFGHQTQHPQYDRFGAQHQAQQQQPQTQPQNHSGFGGLGSAPHDYNSPYYNSEAQRNAYGQYYGTNNSYAGQDGRSQAQQDSALGQRSASGYTNAPSESGFGSQQPQQTQSRYNEAANSGHSTPNPHAVGQQGSNAQQSAMHQQMTQQQQQAYQAAAAAGFPYGHPYFNSPYQQAYQNQFGYSQYGAGYPSQGKQAGGYSAPYGQQMGSQPSYDQHSSSGGSGAFSQAQGQQSSIRTASGMSSSLGSGLDEYGRSTSQTQSASGFGGINDAFGRGQSGFSQAGYNSQTTTAGPEDALKPYADQKAGSSPSLGQPGRPASAANNQAATSQQQTQGGFGGYQGFQGQSQQYGGLGGLGGHQQGQANQQAGYSGYNANAFAQYGSYNSRGGWGQSYGTH